jgi:hypothetical protein
MLLTPRLSLARFVFEAGRSVLHDLSVGSPAMDRVTDTMKLDGTFGYIHSKAFATMKRKPPIRCENCTKRPEDVEGNPNFMACGACKQKLDFIIHYCSKYV